MTNEITLMKCVAFARDALRYLCDRNLSAETAVDVAVNHIKCISACLCCLDSKDLQNVADHCDSLVEGDTSNVSTLSVGVCNVLVELVYAHQNLFGYNINIWYLH